MRGVGASSRRGTPKKEMDRRAPEAEAERKMAEVLRRVGREKEEEEERGRRESMDDGMVVGGWFGTTGRCGCLQIGGGITAENGG